MPENFTLPAEIKYSHLSFIKISFKNLNKKNIYKFYKNHIKTQEMTVNKLYNKKEDNLSDANYEINLNSGFCKKGETSQMKRFRNKFAVVTGANGDFGEFCAEKLAEEGCNVILWDLKSTETLKSSLKKRYPNQLFESHQFNICNEQEVVKHTNLIFSEFKKLDILFNNAGYQGDFKNTIEYATDDFQKVMDINVIGAFIVLREVANIMKKQEPQGGAIVNTASMAGIGAPPNMIAYATSKAAVKHMTVIASKDLSPFNIRVNSISPAFIGPGFMWTRQVELQAKAGSIYFNEDPNLVAKQMINEVPMKRYGTIDEVIDPVLFLLSDESSYITGTDIKITGGI